MAERHEVEMTVPDLSTKQVGWSWKRREARFHLLLAGAAGAGAYALHRQDIPDEQLFFRSIVWYTTAASILAVVYVVAVLLVRRFPAARPARLDGRPAVRFTSWPGSWWFTSALDLGLLALTGFWVHLAWHTSADRAFLTMLALLPFLWFAGRWLTRAVGRCRPAALWVTEDEVVRDSERGRERVRRSDITHAHGWDDVDGVTTDAVTVMSSRPPSRAYGPRLLTLRPKPTSDTRMSVDTTLMGHPAPEIATWLSPEPPAPEPADRGRTRTGFLRRWLS